MGTLGNKLVESWVCCWLGPRVQLSAAIRFWDRPVPDSVCAGLVSESDNVRSILNCVFVSPVSVRKKVPNEITFSLKPRIREYESSSHLIPGSRRTPARPPGHPNQSTLPSPINEPAIARCPRLTEFARPGRQWLTVFTYSRIRS